MKDKRILVTGGSGFVGSHLVHRLLTDGANVAVLVRYGNIMKNERLRDCWDDICVIESDLRNHGSLEKGIRGYSPEIVFHLAAYNHVGQSFTQTEECFDVNAKGTANLVDICSDVKKFVYMSTSEVYGYQEQVPFVESMTPNPISPYAITKYAGELYCRMKQRIKDDSSIVIVRCFNIFGPYQSTKAVIPELIINCLLGNPICTTKGEQTREFNYVGDIVEALIKVGLYKGKINGFINIASGQEIAIHDLVKRIKKITGSHSEIKLGALPYRPTEIWRMYADNTKAKQILRWRPSTALDEGLRLTVAWFQSYLSQLKNKNKENAGQVF